MKSILLSTVLALTVFTSFGQRYRGTERVLTAAEKLNNEYCTGLFKSSDGVLFDLTENTTAHTFINILDWLQGRVAGVQIYTTSQGVRFPVIRGQVSGIYVDEMPVPASFINSLNSSDVALIKVFKTPFYGGVNSGGGAIAIYTLRGEDEEEEAGE